MLPLDRNISRLVQQARSTEGVGGNGYRLAAVLLDKKERIVSNVKSNLYRTHPFLLKYSQYPYLHAECNAILSHGLDHCNGLSLLVVRVDRSKVPRLTMAKPCLMCRSLAKDVGIKEIMYSTWEGGFEKICP